MKRLILLMPVILIPILAILPLLRTGYFSMHDVQHPVRLFLLNQGLSQGYLYPRWVDGLGFGYGYSLFNFYPPLIYYIAQLFVFLGFSIINSLKLMLISGFVLAAISSYLYIRLIFNRLAAYIGAAFYTYTFYHAITVYVRGAYAEFYSMALFPLVAYFLHGLILKPTQNKIIGLSLSFAALILCHPLIAFPSLIFIGFYFVLAIFASKNYLKSWLKMALGLVWGLGLSAFFWLPSLVEKNLTLVNDILTKELYNYNLHFIYPSQLYFSPWGFGGSTKGIEDGMSYQIGKYYLVFLLLSVIVAGFFLVFTKTKKPKITIVFVFLVLLFSYFMTLPYSLLIWDKIKYLWYLQFPWRFLTFASFYLSVFASLIFYLLPKLIKNKLAGNLLLSLLIVMACVSSFKYSGLFKPQKYLNVTDKDLVNDRQIKWVISKTSFEFVPKGVKTKKNELGVTTLDISENNLPKKSYRLITGKAKIEQTINKFQHKEYWLDNSSPIIFQLNTYNFAGWQALLDNKPITIKDNNKLKLIRVEIPKGKHELSFVFADTLVRKVGNYISLLSLFVLGFSTVKVLWDEQQKHFSESLASQTDRAL